MKTTVSVIAKAYIRESNRKNEHIQALKNNGTIKHLMSSYPKEEEEIDEENKKEDRFFKAIIDQYKTNVLERK